MISENRTEHLKKHLRYAEIRTLLIAGFSVWILRDIGHGLDQFSASLAIAPGLLSAVSWIAILANHLYSPRIGIPYEDIDERDEFRIWEHLQNRQSRFLRLSLIASCMSVIFSIMTIVFSKIFWL